MVTMTEHGRAHVFVLGQPPFNLSPSSGLEIGKGARPQARTTQRHPPQHSEATADVAVATSATAAAARTVATNDWYQPPNASGGSSSERGASACQSERRGCVCVCVCVAPQVLAAAQGDVLVATVAFLRPRLRLGVHGRIQRVELCYVGLREQPSHLAVGETIILMTPPLHTC